MAVSVNDIIGSKKSRKKKPEKKEKEKNRRKEKKRNIGAIFCTYNCGSKAKTWH